MDNMQGHLAQWGFSTRDPAEAAASTEVYKASLPKETQVEEWFHQQQQERSKKSKKQKKLSSKPPIEQGPVSSVEWKDCQPISLEEVVSQVNHIWSHRVLFLHTTKNSRPFQQSTALWTLVQEKSNKIMILQLWNFLPLDSRDEYYGGPQVASVLPPETSYLALIDPLMVPYRTSKDTSVMLRCDNPQCLVHFDSREKWEHAQNLVPAKSSTDASRSAKDWKEDGNKAFGAKDYILAKRCYEKAFKIAYKTKERDIIVSCLGNMAEVCLLMGNFEEAEALARQILDQHNTKQFKARLRLARALLKQGKVKESQDLLLELRAETAKDKQASAAVQSVLGECLQATVEQRGVYNISKLLEEASLSPILPFHADFCSDSVDLGVPVKRLSDGGTYRGVVAKMDVKEGQLLTVSQAFAFAYQRQQQELAANQKSHLYEVSQVHQAVQGLLRSPRLTKSFYQLEAAGEIDSNMSQETKKNINLAKIRSILGSNRFGVDLNNPGSPFELKLSDGEDEQEYTGIGLWLPVSMYNHSCTPNCTWAQIGNYMFVYASKNVSQGEELCISYVHPALSYLDRKERFAKWSGGKGFECGCEWCHWIRTSPSHFQEMNEEVKRAQMRMGSGGFESMNQLISETRREEIRKAHEEVPDRFQHSIYGISMIEALHGVSIGDRRGVLTAAKRATELGYAIRGGLRQETRVQDLCCLAAAHMACDEDKEAERVLVELCRHQVFLPSLKEFQNFVMMSSMQIWDPYQNEPFIARWALLIKKVWQDRSKKLKK